MLQTVNDNLSTNVVECGINTMVLKVNCVKFVVSTYINSLQVLFQCIVDL